MNQGTIILLGGTIAVVIIVAAFFFMLFRSKGIKPKVKASVSKSSKSSKVPSSLRDEELKSSFVLDAIDDGVFIVDDQKTIRLFNPGATSITGWEEKDAVGLDYHSVIKLVDEKDKPYPDINDPVQRVFKEGRTVRDDQALLISKSGKHLSLSLSVSPLTDNNDVVNAAVVVFRDVSDERQAEHQRAEFISTASHEMRTPVAAIEGYLALALNDKVATVDGRARGFLEKAHTSTQSLGKLFQDLLTSAKADDGRLSNHPQVVELSDFLRKLTDDLKFAANKKGLLMDFVLGSSQVIDATSKGTDNMVSPLYYVMVDPDRLKEVITNLFDNAVKYTDQGKITIGLTGDSNVSQFYIKDTGAGIAAEDIGHLFQKFYRVDNSATRTISGTGLGLFICKKIIELYQGQIWVESELGNGSTFFVNLPRIPNNRAIELVAQQNATASPLSSQ